MLDIARRSATVIRQLKIKNKRLELAVEDMVELGSNSNDDTQKIFNYLYIGIQENREKQKNPACLWELCTQTNKFEDIEDLYIEHINTAEIAPMDRQYFCK